MGQAELIVSRTSDRDLKFRGIEVILDGRHIGDLTFGDTLRVPIAAGSHQLKVTNRLKSRVVEFEAHAGEQIRFETVGIVMGGLWVIMTMLGTVPYRVTLERFA